MDQSSRNRRFGDSRKCRRRADIHDAGKTKDGVIEQVENLHPQLQPVLLPKLKLLVQRDVRYDSTIRIANYGSQTSGKRTLGYDTGAGKNEDR
jgi:hypothetical protein